MFRRRDNQRDLALDRRDTIGAAVANRFPGGPRRCRMEPDSNGKMNVPQGIRARVSRLMRVMA